MPHSERARRAWTDQAVRRIEADFNRSADTPLIPTERVHDPAIERYLQDESSHPTGSLKHRLVRSLYPLLRAVQRLDWPRHDRCGCIERPHCGFRGVLCAHAWAALHRGGAPCERGGADRCYRVPVWGVRFRRPHRDLGRALPERHRGYRSSTGRAVAHCGRGRSHGRGARCRQHRRAACAEGAAGAPVRWLHRHPSWACAQRIGELAEQGLAGSVVSMLCDQGERYASTYCNDQWVAATGLNRARGVRTMREFFAGRRCKAS